MLFERVISFFWRLWSAGRIQSLLCDLVWLSGCKTLGSLNCRNADSSVIRVFSAVVCDVLPGVRSPARIPFEFVHTGFSTHQRHALRGCRSNTSVQNQTSQWLSDESPWRFAQISTVSHFWLWVRRPDKYWLTVKRSAVRSCHPRDGLYNFGDPHWVPSPGQTFGRPGDLVVEVRATQLRELSALLTVK